MKRNLQLNQGIHLNRTAVSIMITLLFLCAFARNVYSQDNIIENPGFEKWNGNQPDNWFGDKSTIAHSNVMCEKEEESGDFSLKLLNIDSEYKRFTTQSYLLDASKEYELVYDVKGVGQICPSFYDGEQRYRGFYGYRNWSAIDNLKEWQKISFTFKPGVESTSGSLSVQIIFAIRSTDASTGLLIDDVSLKEYIPTAVPQRNSNAKISVYRPNSEVIKVTTSTAASSVTILNATGNSVIIVMADNEDKEITIPVKKIASGIYIVVVKLADGTQVTTKFIK